MHCTFIPPWLAERVDGAERAALDEALRTRRGVEARSASRTVVPGGPAWTVHDAGSTTSLPGEAVRTAGDPESGDVAVDEAATGIEATLAMFAEVLSRDSHDDAGAPVSLTVHYGSRYNNAFWDGTQLVFGDGDGKVFERFTKPVDVLAHEFTHAVVEHTAGLVYQGQSGALNESVADVFASCLKQRLLGQDAADGDWLIGEGIFTSSVQARALRDMAAPGTAYDDPELGADPQVGHMDDYVETSDDNGGVHLNSGIPNRAFQLAAVAIGGTAIEGAGRVWYAALVGDDVPEDADFATFAAATVAAAGQHADAVREAWAQVGVAPASGTPVSTGAQRLRVRAQRRIHRPDRVGRGRPRRRPPRAGHRGGAGVVGDRRALDARHVRLHVHGRRRRPRACAGAPAHQPPGGARPAPADRRHGVHLRRGARPPCG